MQKMNSSLNNAVYKCNETRKETNFNFKFGKITLNAGANNCEDCGSNGLPITPNSISIIGTFQALISSINHTNLVQYLDCYRSKNEKVNLVFEFYDNPFNDDLDNLVFDLLHGLYHLHCNLNITHGNITPEAVVFDKKHYKWLHWPLNTITNNGKLLDSFALLPKNLSYISPERAINLKQPPPKKCDIWSFGLLILQYLFPSLHLPRNPATLITCRTSEEILKKLNISDIPHKWNSFFHSTLQPQLKLRANVRKLFSLLDLNPPSFDVSLLSQIDEIKKFRNKNVSQKWPFSIQEVYYFWCLSSSSKKENEIDSKQEPPILRIPSVVILDYPLTSSTLNDSCLDITFIPSNIEILRLDNLENRLNELDSLFFYPLILTKSKKNCKSDSEAVSSLPLIIRENDFVYQIERTLLFSRLNQGFPFLRSQLIAASKIDIAPFYRARTWAAILDVKLSDLLLYDQIDKLTPTSTDRQISVDIPRCHQYNDLLASPKGHQKLTRVLKAWLRHNEANYVYWQGLDSLSAPFVVLNFNNEAMAFASFNAFINKYLRGFFCKDNSTIHEYLAIFSHLIAFHDVTLFNHLHLLNFKPELYSISWFLTMFAHVLPLYKIVHVWDTLLLEDETFPLAIGLSILKQLRDQLLGYTFNDCILIFSDLPEINVEKCVQCAIKLFQSTPKSACRRGVLSLEDLKEEVCARIEMNELVSLFEQDYKIEIIDRRTPQQISKFGAIKNSIKENRVSLIKEQIKSDYFMIVVVNDLQLASQLVFESVPKVISLIFYDKVPEKLLEKN